MTAEPTETRTIYLDHAATSFPKPDGVAEAMARAIGQASNAGRSGHQLALEGARILFRARRALGSLRGVADPRRVILTSGCTEALNTVIHGLDYPAGASIVTTDMEHNAVARPLRALETRLGVRIVTVSTDADGRLPPGALAAAVDETTRLVVVQQASNLTGVLQDLAQVRRECAGVPLLVDAAQSAGRVPIDVDGLGLDFVAVPGHKGLMGPGGIGALCLGVNAPLPDPLMQGGTGSNSEEDRQPELLPDRFEAGTPNVPGAAGLTEGIAWVLARGVEAIADHEQSLMAQFLEGLDALSGVRETGAADTTRRVAVASLVFEGLDPGEVAHHLERYHQILVRSGLHCAPWAHRKLGTFPRGSVRLSFGPTHSSQDVQTVLKALATLVKHGVA